MTDAVIDGFPDGGPVRSETAAAVRDGYALTDHQRRLPIAPDPRRSATG